jgi:DNA-binding MarR family transcriptional regulator
MATPAERQPMSILMDTWLISNLTSGLLDDALQLSGMNGDDFALYSLLNAYGPASPTQIARWTGMRPTTVSAALKRMAGRGHSTQHSAVADRRSYHVGLSETGRAAHAATAKVFWDETRKLAELLGDREPELRHHLQSLDSSLREAAALDPRPYRLSSDESNQPWQLSYQGQPLTPDQEQLVRQYIDFLRTSSH